MLPPPLSLLLPNKKSDERKGRRECKVQKHTKRGTLSFCPGQLTKNEERKGKWDVASLLLFFGTSHSLTFLFYFFLQLPRAGGEWGVAFPCVFLHFTLPPPLSLIAFLFFKWQGHQERKGRREINSNKKQPSVASQWLWSSKYPSSNLLK